MTAEFIAQLAIVVLPICCFVLLVVIGAQLDLGTPECAGPKFTPGYVERSQRAEWAADFAAVRKQLAAEDLVAAPPVTLTTRKDHDDWPYTTQEFEMKWDSFFEGLPEDQAVQRAWAGAGR